MTGYIGERAKRRRRNFILFFTFLLLILFFYYFLPIFKLSDVKPSDNFLPSNEEIISPKIKSTIEELELKIFDKEQKIIFRNNQILGFKEEINSLFLENKKLIKSIKNLSNSSLENDVSDKNKDELINKIKKENRSEINKLKNSVNDLELKNKNILSEIDKYKYEYDLIYKESRKIFSKNIKLKRSNDEFIKKIIEFENLIEAQTLIIQTLKGSSPHN